MGYKATCPACFDMAREDGKCPCGYLYLDANGHTHTATSADPSVYRPEPNIVVVKLHDRAERGRAVERGNSGGEAEEANAGSGIPEPVEPDSADPVD